MWKTWFDTQTGINNLYYFSDGSVTLKLIYIIMWANKY